MKSLLLALSVCMFLGSCCHKVACAEATKPVTLHNFTSDELSDMYLIQNGDTSIFRNFLADSTFDKSFLNINRNSIGEVSLYLPLANKVFTFTDIQYAEKECDKAKCLWQKSYYYVFTGCKVNGQQYGEEINLYK